MKSGSKLFVIMYRPGEKWLKGQPVYNQPLNEHAFYLQTLLNRGVLVMGGPFDEDAGGLAIIKVKSTKEGSSILKQDPAVIKKILDADLIKWDCSFNLLLKK